MHPAEQDIDIDVMMMHIDKDGDGVITPAEAYGRQAAHGLQVGTPLSNPQPHPHPSLTLALTPTPTPTLPLTLTRTLTLTLTRTLTLTLTLTRWARNSPAATRGSCWPPRSSAARAPRYP